MLPLLLASILLPHSAPAPAEDLDFFEKKIRPVLLEHCIKCHGESKQQGGLRLDTKSHFFKGGDSGPLFDANKPADQSRLMKVLLYNSEEKMPPKGKLPDPILADIRTWLSRKAPWPDENPKNIAATKVDFSSHWAFRKIEAKPLPKVSRNDLGKRPMDSFIESQLEEKGLSLSPEADRRTLVKRLYFVLLGLIPTPQQVEAFEKDTHPNAYENLVRSLLDSPHFGERWARHWMDLARYADNKGYIGVGVDRTYPYAYTYRDWLINSFNEDLPYDKFVMYQLAADNPKSGARKSDLAAMGFLTVGRRFINNIHDIIDDRIDVIGRTTQGLTLSCARCHDHKYDPIPTKDYYSLYAILASSHEPSDLPDLGIQMQGPEGESFRAELSKLEEEKRKFTEDNAEMKAKEPRKFSEKIKPYDNRIKQLVNTHPGSPPKAMALLDNANPSEGVVFIRGNPGNRGPKVPRQYIDLISGTNRKPVVSGSGRYEMAQAIANPENPLTARVWVNRVWSHVFGSPLVKTPSDFGIRSDPPTHPELLDFLAGQFMRQGWSTKQLLRELLLSQTFRQTSNSSAASLTKDPENILLGHMNRHRLDFETMHDSLLQLAGKLNESVCGKSVEMFAAPFNTRRALYAFIDRQNLPGILRTFDFALPDTHSPKRFETTVPQQALFMMNSPFVLEQGLAFSQRFENAPDEDARLVAMYRQAYQRQPTSEELSSLKEFIASGPSAGFFQIAQVMLASNEFQFID
ncbi:MAG: PSD1 and planctomycete cytochrome C domain-containing protein [Gemmataceae bacterium]